MGGTAVAKPSVVDAINNATDADLSEIIERRKVLQKEDAALAILERAIATKLNGKPAVVRGKKKGPVETSESVAGSRVQAFREAMGVAIAKNNFNVMKRALLASAANVPYGNIDYALNHPWFIRSPEGISLSVEGKNRFG